MKFKLSRAKRGLYNGDSVPLGYRVGDNKDGRLEVIPSETEVVRAKEGGGKPRVGHVMFESLYRTLTNKAYIGVKEYKENSKVMTAKA